jgi:hypothetical protein
MAASVAVPDGDRRWLSAPLDRRRHAMVCQGYRQTDSRHENAGGSRDDNKSNCEVQILASILIK